MPENKIIPVAPTNKILGHLKEYVDQPLNFLHERWKAHGDIFRFRLAHRSLIVVTHPDYIKHILQENHTNYRKSLAYRKLKLLLGNGLFTSEGDYWLKQRRLAQPSFHKERISSYLTSMIYFTNEVIDKWKLKVKNKESVGVHKEMTELTLKIICKTLLGVDLLQEGKVVEQNLPFALQFMMKRVTSTVNVPMAFPLENHKKFTKSISALYHLIDEIIGKKNMSEGPNLDLLHMLMEAKDEETGETMSNSQLKDEVLTFFLAGHETSAVALSWALYLLACHPEVLNKVRCEVIEVTNKNGLDIDNLHRLNYTKQVIKETMRIISPVWVLGREALNSDTLGGYKVKKGDSIIFSPYLVHRHPEFWDDPELFNPERFCPAKEANRHKFAFFPFGGGPRLCIGANFAMMEMQTILALLIKHFDFIIKEEIHPGYNFSLTLRPAKEIELMLV